MCPAFLAGCSLSLTGRHTIGFELRSENSTLAVWPPSSPVQCQCQCPKVVRYHVTPLHFGMGQVFVMLSLTTIRKCSILEFTVEVNLWQPVIMHTYHVTSSAKLCCNEECFDAGHITQLKDFSVGFLILPSHMCYFLEEMQNAYETAPVFEHDVGTTPSFLTDRGAWSKFPLCKLRPLSPAVCRGHPTDA